MERARRSKPVRAKMAVFVLICGCFVPFIIFVLVGNPLNADIVAESDLNRETQYLLTQFRK